MSEIAYGLWGPSNSGKTSFLAALYLEMQSGEFQMRGRDEASKTFIADATYNLAAGKFPRATDERLGPQVYKFILESLQPKQGWNQQKSHILTFLDGTGFYTSRTTNRAAIYYETLVASNGIIAMIDQDARRGLAGFGHELGNYVSTLDLLLDELPTVKGKIAPFIAFCITKSDLDSRWKFIENYWGQPKLPYTLLEKFLDRDAYRLIQSKCSLERTAVFATSITGRYTTPAGDHRPNLVSIGNNEYQIINKTNIQRHHVREPILWLTEQFK